MEQRVGDGGRGASRRGLLHLPGQCELAGCDPSSVFQVTLRPNGDIVFVYIEVQPVLTRAALYDHEPVAGISGDQSEARSDQSEARIDFFLFVLYCGLLFLDDQDHLSNVKPNSILDWLINQYEDFVGNY